MQRHNFPPNVFDRVKEETERERAQTDDVLRERVEAERALGVGQRDVALEAEGKRDDEHAENRRDRETEVEQERHRQRHARAHNEAKR